MDHTLESVYKRSLKQIFIMYMVSMSLSAASTLFAFNGIVSGIMLSLSTLVLLCWLVIYKKRNLKLFKLFRVLFKIAMALGVFGAIGTLILGLSGKPVAVGLDPFLKMSNATTIGGVFSAWVGMLSFWVGNFLPLWFLFENAGKALDYFKNSPKQSEVYS
ncbi:hypothetical protein [Candidatus Neptunochlamydia vexilliferae]|uniref:MotA/TolQ/ExbB proton channel domain-containing protein n=1 Tax=Candidatus Neptunichlamydia vexilliferae TaxID=1651774 RepID=A0ABS0B328_9BACT|nr:hypothetical protein [Candidatus Neptunochlamydia vexilliferae]MBF5060156.1 hypothetical protein [Candidatus Neptunochlamydia vexilliferae]